jgi:hypothetical protein
LELLLPSRDRRAHWQELGRALDARLPELKLPRKTRLASDGIVLLLVLTSLASFFTQPVLLAVLYSACSAFLVWATGRLTAPFATHVPAECATAGDSVKVALRQRVGGEAGSTRTWDEQEVWETLRRVISEQLDVPLDEVTPDADLVRDLGMD